MIDKSLFSILMLVFSGLYLLPAVYFSFFKEDDPSFGAFYLFQIIRSAYYATLFVYALYSVIYWLQNASFLSEFAENALTATMVVGLWILLAGQLLIGGVNLIWNCQIVCEVRKKKYKQV